MSIIVGYLLLLVILNKMVAKLFKIMFFVVSALFALVVGYLLLKGM
jgi:hypothetical protein